MATITYGTPICIGCKPEFVTMPITNLPLGTIKVRRRIRNDRAAVAFVKTETTVQKWVLSPGSHDTLKLSLLQGINVR